MMRDDDRNVDDLIRIAENIPVNWGLAAGMNAIRGSARAEGISLSVDLHGMLVDLELDDHALELGPQRLAAEISRLASEASTESLRKGMRAIEAGCGADVVAQLRPLTSDQNGPQETPSRTRRTDSDWDESSDSIMLKEWPTSRSG